MQREYAEITELYILWSELSRHKLSPTLATAHYSCPDNAIGLVAQCELSYYVAKLGKAVVGICVEIFLFTANVDVRRSNVRAIPRKLSILCGKNMRHAHFAGICKKCGNMQNMQQSRIRIKLTCLVNCGKSMTCYLWITINLNCCRCHIVVFISSSHIFCDCWLWIWSIHIEISDCNNAAQMSAQSSRWLGEVTLLGLHQQMLPCVQTVFSDRACLSFQTTTHSQLLSKHDTLQRHVPLVNVRPGRLRYAHLWDRMGFPAASFCKLPFWTPPVTHNMKL